MWVWVWVYSVSTLKCPCTPSYTFAVHHRCLGCLAMASSPHRRLCCCLLLCAGRDVRNASLGVLPAGVFDSQTQLLTLDLSDNMLSSLPESMFHRATNLTAVRLARNRFRSLTTETIRPLRHLQLFDVSTPAHTAQGWAQCQPPCIYISKLARCPLPSSHPFLRERRCGMCQSHHSLSAALCRHRWETTNWRCCLSSFSRMPRIFKL